MSKTVSKKEFNKFINSYPRKLKIDITGLAEPPCKCYYDFSIDRINCWNSMVAMIRLNETDPRAKHLGNEHIIFEDVIGEPCPYCKSNNYGLICTIQENFNPPIKNDIFKCNDCQRKFSSKDY